MPLTLSRRLFPAFILIVLLAALVPWAASVLRTPLHSDLVWLYEAFARLASGQNLADSIFEPNPPLSLFTYALPYYMTAITGLPVWMTIFVYIMGLLAGAAIVVKYVVTRLTDSDSYAPLLTAASFVVSQSIMTNMLYGERDHIIAIMLVPFVLMQYALNKGLNIPKRWQWSLFLLGAIAILLKPHHGLIPFFMIVWRMCKQKNIGFMRDADFLSLTIMVLAYGALLCFGFTDYRQIIFPDVVSLYLTTINPDILKYTGMLLLPGLAVLIVAHVMRYRIRHADLVIFMAICAMASLIPYFVQGKGFFYHLFPAMGFFVPSFFLLLAGLLERELKSTKATLVLSIMALLGISYVIFPLNMKLPSYKDYEQMPLTKLIAANCEGVAKSDCSFMMFNDSMGIVHETAYVMGITHATRFPSYWFLPALLKMDREMPGSADMFRMAYAERAAADLARYQPQTLIIGRFEQQGDKFFDYAAYWAVSPLFRAEWEKYEHTGTIDIAYNDYYPGTIAAQGKPVTYDVYRRKAD